MPFIKRHIKTIIFAILTISLTGYVVFFESRSTAEDEARGKKVINFDFDQITYFQIIKPNEKMGFQKSETGWQLLEPILENADNDKINELFMSLRDETYEAVVKKTDATFSELDLNEYGLEKPAIVFNFKNNSGVTHRISVGHIKNFEGQSYLLQDGQNQILLGSPNWISRADERLIDYRDKRIFRGQLAQVESIRMKTLNATIELKKSGPKWVGAVSGFELDQSMIRDILKKIGDTNIEEYVFEGEPSQKVLKESGLDVAPVEVELETAQGVWKAQMNVDKQKNALYLLSDRPTYMARVSPLIWETVSTLTLDSLRDRTSAFVFAADEVKKIFYKSGGKENNLIFNSGAWLMGPTGGPYLEIGKSEIGPRIKKMHEMRISEFIDTDSKEVFTGENMLILKTDRDKLLLQINWGPQFTMNVRGQEREYYYARTQLSDHIFALEKSVIDDLRMGVEQISLKAASGDESVAPAPPEPETEKTTEN